METEAASTLGSQLVDEGNKNDSQTAAVQTILHEHPLLHSEEQTEEVMISRPRKNEMQLLNSLNYQMIQLPAPDDSVDLITYMMKQVRRTDDENASKPEIRHFSHKHTLRLSTLQTNNVVDSMEKFTFLEVLKNSGEKCDACMRQISSAPCYSCEDCNFFIHKCCAGLPSEIQHPFHPDHPLVLIHKATAEFAELFECNACQCTSNGFAYNCASCEFYLDVFCSFLSNTLSHEAHKHPLIVRRESKSIHCDACHKPCEGYLFGCAPCGFNLDILCASYPLTVKHRHDKHPLKLNYVPTGSDSDEFCCEICKEKVNTQSCWFYNCTDCGNAFHPGCICNADDYQFIKFGGSIELKGHRHPLTIVLEKKQPSCCNCAQPYSGISFQCTAAKCQYKVDGLDCCFNLDGICAQIFNIIDYDSQNE